MRSKRWYEFLVAEGLLDATDEEVKKARLRYRRAYKREWARKQRTKKSEVRFSLSPKQFKEIQTYCKTVGGDTNTPTTLARELLLLSTRQKLFIPNKYKLEEIYRNLGLVINTLFSKAGNQSCISELETIEQALQHYLTGKEQL